MPNTSLGNQVAHASKWLILTRVILSSLSFISIIVLARLLTPEDFGLVAIATVITALINAMAQIPVGEALIKEKNLTDEHFNTAWTINLLRALFLASIMVVGASLISEIYSEPKVEYIIYVMALATIISGFSNPKFIIFEKKLDFSKQFFSNSLSSLAAFVVTLTTAFYTQSYWALVVGGIISQLINVILTYKYIPYCPRYSLNKFKELFGFTVWLSLGQIINQINWKLDQIIIGQRISARSLGTYNMGNEIASLPTREISSPLMKTLFPAFTKVSHDKTRLASVYLMSQSILFSVALPIGFGMAFFAEPVIYYMVGEQWIDSVIVIQCLAGVFAIQSMTSCSHALAMALNKPRWIFNRDFTMFVIRVPLVLYALIYHGIIGVLFARIITGVIVVFLNMLMVKKLINKPLLSQITHSIRTYISLLVMLSFLYIWPNINEITGDFLYDLACLSTSVFACAVIYSITHLSLWYLYGKPIGPETKIINVIKNKLGS